MWGEGVKKRPRGKELGQGWRGPAGVKLTQLQDSLMPSPRRLQCSQACPSFPCPLPLPLFSSGVQTLIPTPRNPRVSQREPGLASSVTCLSLASLPKWPPQPCLPNESPSFCPIAR